MKKFVLWIALLVFVSGCSDTSKKPKSLTEIAAKLSELSYLGTVEYTISKVIAMDDADWYTIGDRKILMDCKAYVIAGVDFSEITVEEMDMEKSLITIKLPAAEILTLNIPPSEIKLLRADVATLRQDFSNEEVNKIQQLAQADIELKIKELGIEKEAVKNAKVFLADFLGNLGFTSVNIKDSEKSVEES